MPRILLSSLAILLYTTASTAQNIISQEATEFALVYGYPLLAFQKSSQPRINEPGINNIAHARVLATADSRLVVKPNADTLYSTAVYDLSREDVAVVIPEVPDDQFALFSFYDPFGNNFANIGTGNEAGAGEYRLRLRPGDSYGVELRRNSSDSDEEADENYVNSPCLHGTFLVRWLINATNQDAIHAYQNATTFQSQSRDGMSLLGTPLNMINWNLGNSTPASHVLNLLAQLSPSNPPPTASDTPRVDANLAAAGISAGTYGPTDANLTSANASALNTAATASSSSLTTLNNGWSVPQSNKTGDFGTNYGLRAAIASSGYLMLQAPNAVYPSWSNSTSDEQSIAIAGSTNLLHLGPDESYLYTFSGGKPPVRRAGAGFWSLTAYGEDNYFIATERNVYALGDRSNITYASGALVYDSSQQDRKSTATCNDDTSSAAEEEDDEEEAVFQILIQPADVPPPANWTSNWLPAPSGGGNLSALLSLFGAEEALLDGRYEYPVVTKQAAFIGGSSASRGGSLNNGSANGSSTTTPAPFDGGANVAFGTSVLAAAVAVGALGVAAFI